MNYRKLLIIFIYLLGIGILFLFFLRVFNFNLATINTGNIWPVLQLDTLQSIEIRTKDTFSLKKGSDNWLLLKSNKYALANKEQLQAFLDVLAAVQPKNKEFEDKPEFKAELLNNFEQVILTAMDGSVWKIFINSVINNSGLLSLWIIKDNNEPEYFLVDPRFLQILDKDVLIYADLKVFSFRPDLIKKMNIVHPGKEQWLIQRSSDGNFKFILPEQLSNMELTQLAMDFYLYIFTSMQNKNLFSQDLSEFITNSESNPDTKVEVVDFLKITFWSDLKSDAQAEELVVFYLPAENKYIAYSSRQKGYLTISGDKIAQIGRSVLTLTKSPMIPNNFGKINKVRFSMWDTVQNKQEYIFERINGRWLDRKSAANLVGMDAMIWRLSSLQIEKEAQTGQAVPDNLLPLMQWDFFVDRNEAELTLIFYMESLAGVVAGSSKNSWVRIGINGPLFPLPMQAVSDILGHVPAVEVPQP